LFGARASLDVERLANMGLSSDCRCDVVPRLLQTDHY
jgi:hypothetical protein